MIDIIIVPQGAEYKAIKQGLDRVKNSQALIVPIPIGVNKIAETLTKQQFWQIQPKTVLMMGLCGSLSSQYNVGDAVLYQNCYSCTNSGNLLGDQQLNQLIYQNLKANKVSNNLSLVSALTSDRLITNINKKKQLARQYKASVVDMESFAYLKLLQEKKIAVSILRVVSDDLKSNLPNLESTISKEGKIQPLAMTRKMLKQPLASWKLIQSSLQGLKILEKITRELFDN